MGDIVCLDDRIICRGTKFPADIEEQYITDHQLRDAACHVHILYIRLFFSDLYRDIGVPFCDGGMVLCQNDRFDPELLGQFHNFHYFFRLARQSDEEEYIVFLCIGQPRHAQVFIGGEEGVYIDPM